MALLGLVGGNIPFCLSVPENNDSPILIIIIIQTAHTVLSSTMVNKQCYSLPWSFPSYRKGITKVAVPWSDE